MAGGSRVSDDDLIFDGYAGAGGWDEGARAVGLHNVVGIDNWIDACRTGKAAGHMRICADVSTYPTAPFVGKTRGVIQSPPCQAFTKQGNYLGEQDQVRVHQLVDRMAHGRDDWQDMPWADDRSHHTAQPVRWVRDLRPEFVCLEQVQEVLPLWKHIGMVLRSWGYSVWTGLLCAADYGTPQTRRRALLIASRVRKVSPPVATHYDPERGVSLFGGPEWLSMGDALGWPHGPDWSLRNNTNVKGCVRSMNQPAGTIFFGARKNDVSWIRGDEAVRVDLAEASVLQGFRPDFPWRGSATSRFHQVGNAIPPQLAAAVIGAATGLPVSGLVREVVAA
jgi:DNA (cytosine-5)-methyltransferase 1